MLDKRDKLIIIDGNALIHRSFHALPPTLRTKDGLLVNAVYGFTSFLLKAIAELKPKYIALTLDKKGPTFRHQAYAEYKATRVKAADELYEQIPLVREVAQALNIPIFAVDGYEADDLIGTICQQLNTEKNLLKIIITGDLDALQLVNKSTLVYTMSRGLSDTVIYDENKVQERYGLTPNQIIDYKALRGDPSDNIPGVRGIGEKMATELLQNFKDLNNLYKAVEKNDSKIKARPLELLKEQHQEALLSQELATINKKAPIKIKLGNLNFNNFDIDKTLTLFNKLEFRSLVPKLQNLQALSDPAEANKKSAPNKPNSHCSLIETEKDFKVFFTKIKNTKLFAFTIIPSQTNDPCCAPLGIAFCLEKGTSYFLNLRSQTNIQKNKEQNLFSYQDKNNKTESSWIEELKTIFADSKIKKVGHNLKLSQRFFLSQGFKAQNLYFDTMIAAYLLSPENRRHDLESLAFVELGEEKIKLTTLLGEGRQKIDWPEVNLDKLTQYAGQNAEISFRLANKFLPQLKKQELDKLFFDIEMPLIDVLAEMENQGIIVDKKRLKELDIRLSEALKKLENKIHKIAGKKFNISSTKQLREVLFEDLGIPTKNIKKTKTGFSTAEDELNKLWDAHPIVPLLKDHRELSKLLSTYIKALPELINPHTGRIHSSFNQTITATGRLSSSDPNLQNIPTKTELGKQVRTAFVATPGYKLLSFDYSQIELRLVAAISGDKTMIDAFNKNLDIHKITAAAINEVALDEVTPKMRSEAKAVNFGIIYGQGPHGLSQGAGIPFFKAKEFIDKYFISYPKIKKFMDKTIEQARNEGYVSTLFGRKRALTEINSDIAVSRRAAERMAINMPIQGTAADLIKIAMIKVQQLINNQEKEIRLLLQVHDELIFEVKNDKLDKYIPEIKKIMEEAIRLKVPIIASHQVGDNWGQLK